MSKAVLKAIALDGLLPNRFNYLHDALYRNGVGMDFLDYHRFVSPSPR